MVTKEFKREYARLNPEQKKAVDAIEGPVMVVAGPGTGKTTILTLRIANILLKTDTPPSGILALTFTDSGARAMKAKLREIIGERALEVPVHTFHSFASSVINEFQDHLPHLSRCTQITEVETETLLRDILKKKEFKKLRPLGEPDFYIPKIIGAISGCKQEAWTPEMVKQFAREETERVKESPESLSTRGQSKGRLKAEALKRIERCEKTAVFCGVYEEYENKKRESKKIDFDDLIFELLQALKNDKLLLQMLQEKYLYILLDEHQDTNDAQNRIVEKLSEFFNTPNLFVVGDEKQAIYRFQGASVENFLNFQKKWGSMKVIPLSKNYRSHQGILDASFAMIEKNYSENEHETLRVKLISTAKKSHPVELAAAPDTETEEACLAEKLKKIIDKKNGETAAVIVRKNAEVARIFSLLEGQRIPASAERGANIFSHPIGMIFFSLLRALADPSDSEALCRTFAGGLWGLDFRKQTELIKEARSGEMSKISRDLPVLNELRKEMSRAGAMEFMHLAADISGLSGVVFRDPLSVEVWRGLLSLAEELARAEDIESPIILSEKLLSYAKSAEKRVVKINTGKVSAQIMIMTAHGSKGLEFDSVFLPYATEESWIRKNRGSYFVLPKEKEEGDDEKDERRLFYVALTRARKEVFISFSESDSSGRLLSPLRFIEELDKKRISKKELHRTALVREPESFQKIKRKRNIEETEYAKRVLVEKGLSVTALNHFLECPSKFFYKSILKLPEAPSASSEKGNAMHEAVANVWKSNPTRPISSITKIITTSVRNYFKKSFLAANEKEAALEELLEGAPFIASALAGHFAQQGNVKTESWAEREIFGVRLHGKLDAVIEQNDKVLIYDYKTMKGMTPAEIKGETKSSKERGNGDYFRQLVFYKILLDGDSRYKGKVIEPALVFIKSDAKGRCPEVSLPIEKSDIEKVKSEIKSLLDSVQSGKFLSQTCSDPSCQYCGFHKIK